MSNPVESRAAPKLDRLDRHVKRSCVRMSDKDSRRRVTSFLEESLRLANLPGEEEGRIYCFRTVSLSGIPALANRKIWMDRVQQALSALAALAVHGTDARAESADVVYFHHYQEALETLLRHALQSEGKLEWFSASILGVAPGNSPATQIPVILELLLRDSSIPMGAAASIILSALGPSHPVPLLAAIPVFTIRDWVRELDGQKRLTADADRIQLPSQIRTALLQAASHFGWSDLRTIWLAALAVITLSPAAAAAGTAVKWACLILRRLEATPPDEPADRVALPPRSHGRSSGYASRRPIFDDDEDPELSSSTPEVPQAHVPQTPRTIDAPSGDGSIEGIASDPPLLGEPTQAAGLYFLLNALRRLRIATALESCPALAEAGFVNHLMRQVATHANVSQVDPILLCLHREEAEFSLPAAVLAELPFHSKVWPPNIRPPRCTDFDSPYLLGVWLLAVRRWCWRTGRITVREIVKRNGRIWLTRTDLDITLPLSATDIRVRRVGLDIDPGWLPWFGEFGRVVRFHYRDREPGRAGC
jgi:hypothetical protein